MFYYFYAILCNACVGAGALVLFFLGNGLPDFYARCPAGFVLWAVFLALLLWVALYYLCDS